MTHFVRRRATERGVVGLNLVLTICFALYAVIMLSSTTLSAKRIDDHVKVIVTEVGPGSNVSRLDETQKLNTIGKTAEDILAAAKPLSGQAQKIIEVSASIDNTVSAILANANEINATVNSIGNTASALLPVVRNINGDESDNDRTGGVSLINRHVGPGYTLNVSAPGSITLEDGTSRPISYSGPSANEVVASISSNLGDANQVLGTAGVPGHTGFPSVHLHVNSIDCALGSGLLGALKPSTTCNAA